jgi:hypothetical protein
MWAELDLLAKNPIIANDQEALPAAEIEEMLKSLDDIVAENGNVREIKDAARMYELKRNRSQLIRHLELASAFAKEMGDPIVISLIQNTLARLRE